jgi:hypothetical protein
MWETQQMEDIEDGQWLTLAELADARHTSEDSATRLVRRHTQWRRQRDNQGHVRVLVPAEALMADVREDVLEDVRQQDSEAVMAAVDGLIARAEQAETEADRHRERADAAEARAGRIEKDRDRADAVIVNLESDLRAKDARIDQATAEATEQRERLERDLAVAQHDAQTAQRAADALQRADEARQARGRLRRVLAAWRGGVRHGQQVGHMG